jgi:hypothetical protein
MDDDEDEDEDNIQPKPTKAANMEWLTEAQLTNST